MCDARKERSSGSRVIAERPQSISRRPCVCWLEDPASYARVISHAVPHQAAPGVFARLLAGDSQDITGVPGVKVIIDFTNDGDEVAVFEPER